MSTEEVFDEREARNLRMRRQYWKSEFARCKKEARLRRKAEREARAETARAKKPKKVDVTL